MKPYKRISESTYRPFFEQAYCPFCDPEKFSEAEERGIKDTMAITSPDLPYAISFLRNYVQDTSTNTLGFFISPPNEKLEKGQLGAYSLDMLAGVTCPNADKCKAFAQLRKNPDTGLSRMHLKKPGEDEGGYACYAAKDDARKPAVYLRRYYNTILAKHLGGASSIKRAIEMGLHAGNLAVISKTKQGKWDRNEAGEYTLISPPEFTIKKGDPIRLGNTFRLHTSGDFGVDFLKQVAGCLGENDYFKAWVDVAKSHPEIAFYGYTKMISVVDDYVDTYGDLPENFKINLSKGGKEDEKLDVVLRKEGPKSPEKRKAGFSIVVKNEEEARQKAEEMGIEDYVYVPAGGTDTAAAERGKNNVMFLQVH